MTTTRCINCMKPIEETAASCPHCGYAQQGEPFPFGVKPGTILRGRYLVGRVLGQGGFGITYVGYDLTLEIKIAVKEYFPSGAVTRNNTISNLVQWNSAQLSREQWQAGCESFLKEARRMAKLDSLAGIVRVRDTFPENQTAYIVMDYIEGETLKDRLMRNGVMKVSDCLQMLRPLMESLDEMHGQGLVHRDISPDNIMVQPNGRVCLLDFGAAKDISLQHSMSSQQVAKKGFSPPEQYREKGHIGSWTDVYALCATIYYCVTGRLVPDAMDRLYEDTLSFDRANAETLNQKLIDTLEQGLKLRTEERIQTVGEVLERLEDALQNPPEPEPYRDEETPKKEEQDSRVESDQEVEEISSPDGKPLEAESAEDSAQVQGTDAKPAEESGQMQDSDAECNENSGQALETADSLQQPEKNDSDTKPEENVEDVQPKPKKKMRKIAVCAAAVVAAELVVLAATRILSGSAGTAQKDTVSGLKEKEAAVSEQADNEISAESEEISSEENTEILSYVNVLMADDSCEYSSVARSVQGYVLGSGIGRDRIMTVTFLDSLDKMADNAWDVSWEQDGTVMAWTKTNPVDDLKLDLYIGAEGGVKGRACEGLFKEYHYVERIYFNGCFDTSQATDMSSMFEYCESLQELDLSNFDTSQITDMHSMFYWCKSLQELDLSEFDTGQVTGMNDMFGGCKSLQELDLSEFDTSQVTDMSGMFWYCESLQELNLRGFDTSQVTDMSSMFCGCKSLRELDLNEFDTSQVTDMAIMFSYCTKLTKLNLSSFNTSQVTSMHWMFSNCESLSALDLSNFDIGQTEYYTSGMFDNCGVNAVQAGMAGKLIVQMLPLIFLWADVAVVLAALIIAFIFFIRKRKQQKAKLHEYIMNKEKK